MGTINTEYTQKNFTDWLNKAFPWIHEVKDTDKIIAAAEVAYRAELKLHEEEMATNEAYLAKLESDKAEEVAAAKMLAAKEANEKVAMEAEKLAKAEADLQAAKDRVAKLEKLKLDTEAAAIDLGRALDLVGKAKADAGAAQEAAAVADADAKAAQDIADALKPAAPTSHRSNSIVAVIAEPETPLAEMPTVTAIEIEKEIANQDVPMVALPETSGTAPLLIYMLGLLFVAGGIVLKRRVA